MSYVVLARKWRPQEFADLVGQEPIVRTLENAIKLKRLSHALLLTGPRGVGKTTTARILAKALNCEKGPEGKICDACSNCTEIAAGANVDVREIDGASNALVEDVRDLIENVRYAPAKSRHKIYIIDEVHMLSKSAFNALLKTLEEPPPGVMFIFATTEPQKIPDTIHSRCQRFDFKQISEEQIISHLTKITAAEKISIGESSLALVARQAEGSLRDALSLLDQVIAFSGEKISDDDVASILGLSDRELIVRTLEAFVSHDPQGALSVLEDFFAKGFDPKAYLLEVWERVRDLLVLKAGADEDLVRVTLEERSQLKAWASDVDEAELERWFDLLRYTLDDVRRSESPRYVMEVAFLKATRNELRVPLAELVERLEALEGGSPRPRVSNPGPAKVHKPVSNPTPKVDSSEWEKLVGEMKRKKPSWAAILLQASKSEIADGKVILTYEEGSFYVSRAKDADFDTFLAGVAAELFGGTYKVEIRTEPKIDDKSVAPAAKSRKREREALENPAIQKAVSMFEAKIEEIKPLK